MKKKKIVFVINFFHPDYASTGQLMTELCLHLQNDFDITVIAQQPDHMEQTNNGKRFTTAYLESIEIIRIRLPQLNKTNKLSRIKYILSYFFFAQIALLKLKNVDMIYSISSPPIIGGLIGTIGKLLKGAKHIYNIQDFNPEQAEAVSFTDKKWLFQLARKVDNISCKLADHVITVGEDMRETLLHRFKNSQAPSNTVINNWTDEKQITPLPKEHPKVQAFLEQYGLTNKFVIMYSGNLGLYYDLENMISITEHFRHMSHVAFVFIGDGAVKGKMQQFVEQKQLPNVHFIPFQPKDQIIYSLNAADIHLVVNQKGIKGVSVPSKIYGVMAAGKPILGVLEKGSEASNLIEHSQCGYTVEPQDYNALIDTIRNIVKLDRHQLIAQGLLGREYLEQHLRKEVAINKYRHLLANIG
ncbi:glycosyltransferase family 4 protein [Paenibacillus sp. YYML68]|uniref:glycosyltransferase family 4 protein n=1 Tax=Paenibacillus sp. YYML68 TaxID=2909250 RepID=UPI00249017D1|nr:glycosyltransferase family 4 protein [Paenibacillus sp. YYML68]